MMHNTWAGALQASGGQGSQVFWPAVELGTDAAQPVAWKTRVAMASGSWECFSCPCTLSITGFCSRVGGFIVQGMSKWSTGSASAAPAKVCCTSVRATGEGAVTESCGSHAVSRQTYYRRGSCERSSCLTSGSLHNTSGNNSGSEHHTCLLTSLKPSTQSPPETHIAGTAHILGCGPIYPHSSSSDTNPQRLLSNYPLITTTTLHSAAVMCTLGRGPAAGACGTGFHSAASRLDMPHVAGYCGGNAVAQGVHTLRNVDGVAISSAGAYSARQMLPQHHQWRR